MSHSKKLVLIVLTTLSSLSSVVCAQSELITGGYNRELQTMEMMSMLDANGNHMVSKVEFNTYYNKLFDTLDMNRDKFLDEKEWNGTIKENIISLGTGGYIKALGSMKMMGAMDSDANNKVSRQEFLSFHETIFNTMDAKNEGEVDPQSWLSKQTHN